MRVVNDVVVFTLPEVAAASGDYQHITRGAGVSIMPMDIENPDARATFPKSCRRGFFIVEEWHEARDRFEPPPLGELNARLPRRRERIGRVRFREVATTYDPLRVLKHLSKFDCLLTFIVATTYDSQDTETCGY
jgi:hypothetical protein